ncbi:DUF6011 domain-containing protein [Prevotella sp.]
MGSSDSCRAYTSGWCWCCGHPLSSPASRREYCRGRW